MKEVTFIILKELAVFGACFITGFIVRYYIEDNRKLK